MKMLKGKIIKTRTKKTTYYALLGMSFIWAIKLDTNWKKMRFLLLKKVWLKPIMCEFWFLWISWIQFRFLWNRVCWIPISMKSFLVNFDFNEIVFGVVNLCEFDPYEQKPILLHNDDHQIFWMKEISRCDQSVWNLISWIRNVTTTVILNFF